MPEPLWNLKSVVLRGTHRNRLDGVTCSIEAGVTAILGSSGAGKTSLLNLLAGMETPDSGSIERTFDPVTDGLPLYWAPQGGGLWPHLTVQQHLAEVGFKKGSGTVVRSTLRAVSATVPDPFLDHAGEVVNFADKLLDEFDLTDRLSAFPAELSQGERARLSVARALAIPAQVLLFDEPLVHVDGERKATGWHIIRQTIENSGTHLVLATHEPETAMREADSVICLADGRLAWEGPVTELYHHPPNRSVGQFLGPLNWFDVEDQKQWLPADVQRDQPLCVRPEQLHLESTEPACPNSTADAIHRCGEATHTFEVVRSQFMGSYADTTVRSVTDHVTRTFVHRPTGVVDVGRQVVLRFTMDDCNG